MKFFIGLSVALISSCFPAWAKKDAVYHTCSPRDSPKLILACAMYHEARGEGFEGMWAVGNVIMNRKRDKSYPTKIKKVIYQKGQFSYTRKNDLKVRELSSWLEAKKAANTLIILDKNFQNFRDFYDTTSGALFFYRKGVEPSWLKRYYIHKLTYKRHVFYGES